MILLSAAVAIPVLAYNDKVEFLFNGYKYGHDNIVLENKDTGDKNIIYGVDIKMKYNDYLGIRTITVNHIKPGVYETYSIDDTLQEESIRSAITVIGDMKRPFVEKAISFINANKNEQPYAGLIEKITEGTDVVPFIFSKAIADNDTETKYKYAATLYSVIDLMNYNMSASMENSQTKMDSILCSIKVDPDTRELMIIDITDIKSPQISIVKKSLSSDTIELMPQENHLYAVIPIDKNDDARGIYYTFRPKQEVFAKFLNNSIERKNEYQLTIEKNIDYPNSYMEFSDAEKNYLAIIDKLSPVQPLIKEPVVSHFGGLVMVQINDMQLISALNKDLYVSFRETELALDLNDQRRIKISGEEFSFYTSSLMMSDEDYLYWIEDQAGNILSPVRLFSLVEVDYSDGTAEEPETDFNERARQLALHNYSLHLTPYLANNFEENKGLIMNAFKSAETDTVTGTEGLVKTILTFLCLRQNYSKIRTCIRALMEDRTIYGNYLVEFLTSPVRFKYKQNTVVLPPKQNCLYVFDKYTVDQGIETDYVMSQAGTATEYRFYNCDYGVVWCIDTDTYKISGFVLIDFSTKQLEPYSYKFLIDELEVIY